MRARNLFAAYALDWCIGDPEWLPHPVRSIGKGIEIGERLLRSNNSIERCELFTGGILTAAIVAGTVFFTAWPVNRIRRKSRLVGDFMEIILASSCLATRNLLDEGGCVLRALEAGDIPFARKRLARIVGRDTENLDTSEISRAVIETLAESLSDGIVAPLFFLAIGGAPSGMAYKAANTLDSMIGHRDERYLYFGRAAARLDDLANYIPSRISALLICCSSVLLQATLSRSAFSVWIADGGKHASPNAGQPESAMAGALQVRLGGANTYGGEVFQTPYLGEQFDTPTIAHARGALRLTAIASIVGAAAAVFLLARIHD
jgi:adenosylcobinamide-phosphate synthase